MNRGRLLYRALSFLLVLGIGGAWAGCRSPATRPTPVFGDLQLGVAASASTSSNTASLELSGGLIVNEARINLRRIDLVPDTVADPGIEYEGPFVVDVIQAGTALNQETPSFPLVRVPVDTYSEIKFRIDPLGGTEIPLQGLLTGNSIVMEGSFPESPTNDIDGNGKVSSIPFQFLSDMGSDLRLDIPDPFSVVTGNPSFIFLALQLNSWFEPALSSLQGLTAADLTSGRVLLVDTSASAAVRDLVDRIEDGVRGGTKFAESVNDQFDEQGLEEESQSEIDPDFSLGDENPLGEGEEVVEDQLFLTDVRMSLDRFRFNEDTVLEFDGPFVLSLLRDGLVDDSVTPAFESLGIPAGSYTSLEFFFEPLSFSEIPNGAADDDVATGLLIDGSLAVTGVFLESPENDIDGDGAQGFIFFALVSDDHLNSFLTEGITEEVRSLLLPLLDPTVWFDGTLPLLQGLDPSLLDDGAFFLFDSSPSEEIRTIVDLVEANLDNQLP